MKSSLHDGTAIHGRTGFHLYAIAFLLRDIHSMSSSRKPYEEHTNAKQGKINVINKIYHLIAVAILLNRGKNTV